MPEPKLRKLVSLLDEKRLEGALVVHPSNIRYLTGVGVGGSALLVSVDGDAQLLVPPLEYHRAMGLSACKSLEVRPYYKYELRGFEAPGLIRSGLVEAVAIVADEMGLSSIGADLAFVSQRLAAGLEKRLGDRLKGDISGDLSALRAVKDPDEIEAIREAVRVAEEALESAWSEVEEGISELELAGMIEHRLRRGGAEEHAFPIIVAFSEDAAYPHVAPRRRQLRRGDAVLVDLGARISGYCSDMTRTWFYGEPPPRAKRILEAVVEALLEGIDAIAPGVRGSEIDERARRILEKHGFSGFFIHSLGHGVGIDVHEAPRLAPGSEDVLREGMVVTVEPGVYIPGNMGIRVEDMVLVTKKGADPLTRLAREASRG